MSKPFLALAFWFAAWAMSRTLAKHMTVTAVVDLLDSPLLAPET